jgi:CheY-like chemotaxis protein
MFVICKQCQTPNAISAQICGKCGVQLSGKKPDNVLQGSSPVLMVDYFFLKPLAIIYGCLMLVFLFKTAWLVAAWFVLAWLINGAAGASLHPKLTVAELARQSWPVNVQPKPDGELSHEDSFRIARALFTAAAVCAVSGFIVSRHSGFVWWIALLVSVAVLFGSLALGISPVIVLGSIARRRAGNSVQQPIVSERPRILVFDAIPDNAIGLAELLERWGYAAVAFSDISQLLAEAMSSGFDLMLLDFYDSYVSSHVSHFLELPAKILLVGFDDDGRLRLRLPPDGSKRFLEKPIDPEALKQNVQDLLRDTARTVSASG